MQIEALRERVKSLPPLPPESEREFWQNYQADIRKHLLQEDPSLFLTWPSITGTMFVGDCDFVAKCLDALKRYDWPRWERVLVSEGFGSPESRLHPGTTGNLIYQAYHLMQWEQAAGCKISDLGHIVEIGAGYGALAGLVRRLGFRGVYLIFDLPEIIELQKLYLGEKANYTGDPEQLVQMAELTDLLIGIYSLSEIPLPLRNRIAAGISANSYLIAYQDVFEGDDNRAWFAQFQERRSDLAWETRDAVGLPTCRYLIGRKP